MRVKITFSLQRQDYVMPHYQQTMLATWLESIKTASETWHDYSLYNFSSLRGQATSQQAGLDYLPGQIKLVISSPNQAFLDFVTGRILEQKDFRIGPLHLTPVNAQQEPIPELSDVVKYLCISPLVPSYNVLEDEQAGQAFIHPKEDQFSDLLYECTMKKMEASGLYSTEEIKRFCKFQLVPDQYYLNKLKKQGKLFARVYPVSYRGKEYEIRTYVFPFTLYATKQVQEYVYTHGLGAFTEHGLGMLDTKSLAVHPS